jgi:hypothetical protein
MNNHNSFSFGSYYVFKITYIHIPSKWVRINKHGHRFIFNNLIDARNYLQSELDQWEANPKDETNPDGYWLHPEDLVINMKLIKAMDLIIGYYGGEF